MTQTQPSRQAVSLVEQYAAAELIYQGQDRYAADIDTARADLLAYIARLEAGVRVGIELADGEGVSVEELDTLRDLICPPHHIDPEYAR